ncbi:transient receptor potential cation channel protein painless-like [Planococcus citri]|uniref:transient receptor potential cation channel protein painless-like n=1 Tax=Planococcus citri TaxID=170843 RepID=UPI0031F91EDF
MDSESIELLDLRSNEENKIMLEIEEHVDHIFNRMKDEGISYDDCDAPENPLLTRLIEQLQEQRSKRASTTCSSDEMFFEGNWVGDIVRKFCPHEAEQLQQESDQSTTPIMKAVRYGNFSALEKLMNERENNLDVVPRKTILLSILDGIIACKYSQHPGRVLVENLIAGKGKRESIRDAYFPPTESVPSDCPPDHYKCLEYVFKNIPLDELDINFEDESGNTALHYAVAWKETEAIMMLLQAGAYACKENKNEMIPLKSINSQVLEQYLDNCISSNNYPSEHTDYQITIDYTLFMPPKQNSSAEQNKKVVRESEPIQIMHDSSRLKKLLSHPVIRSYLYLKWRIVQKYFYCNLIVYFIYWFLLNSHLYCIFYQPFDANKTNETHHRDNVSNSEMAINHFTNMVCELSTAIYWKISIAVVCIVLIFREVYQFFVLPKAYSKSLEDWFELFLFGSTIYILFFAPTCPTLASGMVLVSWMELVLLIGRHPRLSTHIEMFKTVALNFFKFLLLYSIMIVAFAFSFYILFKDKKEVDGKPNIFRYLISSIFKTLLMLTGEFDDSSVPLEDKMSTGHLVLILFTFLIAIVLLNLLSGLAVGDTQKIRNEAELVGVVSRINFIAHIESMAVHDPLQCLNFIDKLLCQNFCCCFSHRPKRKPEHLETTCVMEPSTTTTSSQRTKVSSSFIARNFHERISLTHTLQNGKVKIFPNRGHLKQKKIDPEIIKEAVNVLKRRKPCVATEIDECCKQILQNLKTKLSSYDCAFLERALKFSDYNFMCAGPTSTQTLDALRKRRKKSLDSGLLL